MISLCIWFRIWTQTYIWTRSLINETSPIIVILAQNWHLPKQRSKTTTYKSPVTQSYEKLRTYHKEAQIPIYLVPLTTNRLQTLPWIQKQERSYSTYQRTTYINNCQDEVTKGVLKTGSVPINGALGFFTHVYIIACWVHSIVACTHIKHL